MNKVQRIFFILCWVASMGFFLGSLPGLYMEVFGASFLGVDNGIANYILANVALLLVVFGISYIVYIWLKIKYFLLAFASACYLTSFIFFLLYNSSDYFGNMWNSGIFMLLSLICLGISLGALFFKRTQSAIDSENQD